MSSGNRADRQRWQAIVQRASLPLLGAIAACGSRSGIELLPRADLDAPELEVAAVPEDVPPPAEAELAAPAGAIGAPTACVDITRRYASSPPTVLLLIDQSS